MIKPNLNKQSGFTLLEIVVAVAIFGVIASIIFPALFQFLEMRERVDEKNQQMVSLQKTFQFLANDLRFAANRIPKDEFGDAGKTTLKINDDQLIDLTSFYPDISLNGLNVPRRVNWQLQDGNLQRVQYPVMDPESETRLIVQDLLKDVENVDIQVHVVEDGRDSKDNEWEEQGRLPDLIDIVIEMPDGIEYRRVFSMLGADTGAVIPQGDVQQAGDPNGEGGT